MDRSVNKHIGTLKVSENVIATITKLSTCEVEGVEKLSSSNNKIPDFLLNNNSNKSSIKIRLTGDVVEITVGVIAKFGYNVVTMAEHIQESVKSSVQSMTGVTVARVNVNIVGITFENKTKVE